MNQVVADDYPGATVDVPVVRLDDVLAGFDAVLWKVDVEGYEEEVVEGALERLGHPALKAVMLETETPRVIEAMKQSGFQPVGYDAFARKFTEPGARHSSNQLWIRDRPFCEERVKSSRSFRVFGVEV